MSTTRTFRLLDPGGQHHNKIGEFVCQDDDGITLRFEGKNGRFLLMCEVDDVVEETEDEE